MDFSRILEWESIPFSRGSSQPRDWTQVFPIAGRFFTSWVTREAPFGWKVQFMTRYYCLQLVKGTLDQCPLGVFSLIGRLFPGSPAITLDDIPSEQKCSISIFFSLLQMFHSLYLNSILNNKNKEMMRLTLNRILRWGKECTCFILERLPVKTVKMTS